MAMNVGSRRGSQVSAINMTPMIDVLLVLLIIFMVVQQQLQRGLSLQVPPTEEPTGVPQGTESLVLEVGPNGVYRLNQQPIATASLRQELSRVFSSRNRKVLFIKADERVPYRDVVSVVDESRAAGVTVIGLVPRQAS
jgi:biopolymer transport protein TolR